MGTQHGMKVKVLFKHETQADWDKSTYIPDKGEKVLYDPDASFPYTRVKYGDGTRSVKNLPFAISEISFTQADRDALSNVVLLDENSSFTLESGDATHAVTMSPSEIQLLWYDTTDNTMKEATILYPKASGTLATQEWVREYIEETIGGGKW